MPLYEFRCQCCGHTTERVRSIENRDKGPDCTECCDEGQQTYYTRMTRVPGAPAFTVNGFNAKNGYSNNGK